MAENPDFPAVFKLAEKASLTGQTTVVRGTFIYYIALLTSAAGGLGDLFILQLNVSALATVMGFGTALACSTYLANRKPEEEWYKGRAAAESVKTLSWRFAMRAPPFRQDNGAVALLVVRTGEVLSLLESLALSSTSDTTQVTTWMKETRSTSLDERRRVYRKLRVQDQADWYSRKSRLNNQRGQQWFWGSLLFTVLGLLGGLGRLLDFFSVDILSLCATAAAATSAWTQLRQHRTLATAYAVASQELGMAQATLDTAEGEDAWLQAVSDTEEAMSREHTTWLAQRRATTATIL